MPRRSSDRPCSVYLIECAGYTKIGVAVDPLQRLPGINTGSPVKATLYRAREFGSVPMAHRIEAWMHRKFAALRTNGEWFDLSPAVAWEVLERVREPKRLGHWDMAANWPDDPADERITNLLTANIGRPSTG
jgi:hypothetical protein